MVVGLLLAFFTSVAVDSVERPKRVSLLYGYAPDVPVHDAPHNHVPEKVEKEQEEERSKDLMVSSVFSSRIGISTYMALHPPNEPVAF